MDVRVETACSSFHIIASPLDPMEEDAYEKFSSQRAICQSTRALTTLICIRYPDNTLHLQIRITL